MALNVNTTHSDDSTKHDSPARLSQNNSNNFLDIIMNDRKLSDLSVSKDAPIEADLSDL